MVLFILLLISTTIFSQDMETVTPDSTIVKAKNTAVKVLKLLYENDFHASDYIMWEEFVLNGADYSEDYWDAYDWEEEDLFAEDMISSIYYRLHYEDDTEDNFIEWSARKENNIVRVACHNKKKNVDIILKISSLGNPYVTEIAIGDREK